MRQEGHSAYLQSIKGLNQLDKCPCEQCISLAMCISRKLVRVSLLKCVLLGRYITSERTALAAVECLKPLWFQKHDPGDKKTQAETSGIVRYAKYMEDERMKKILSEIKGAAEKLVWAKGENYE